MRNVRTSIYKTRSSERNAQADRAEREEQSERCKVKKTGENCDACAVYAKHINYASQSQSQHWKDRDCEWNKDEALVIYKGLCCL